MTYNVFGGTLNPTLLYYVNESNRGYSKAGHYGYFQLAYSRFASVLRNITRQ